MPEIVNASIQKHVSSSAVTTNTVRSLCVLILIATCALFLRLDDLNFVTESLSYEDGFLYVTEAHKLGLKSLLIPYSGYLNTYPRMVGLLTSVFPLVAAPYLFFSAWCLSFYSIAWVLRSRANVLDNSFPLIAFLVIAIALQPNHGTAFFHLTTANVFLAVALVIYICIPSKCPPKLLEVVFLTIASITGPYSTFMLPVLAAQLVLFRDFHRRKAVYLIVMAGGLIQLIVLLMSDRIRHGSILPGYTDWTRAVSAFLLFGDGDRLSLVAAGTFWLFLLAYTVKFVAFRKDSGDGYSWLDPVFAIASAIYFFALGTLAAAPFLPKMSPMDLLSRYFIVPYSLVFVAALICTKSCRAAQTVVMCLISALCGARFLTVDHPGRATSTGLASHTNMQWIAYTKFQKVKPELVIPINSALPVYPTMPFVQVTETARQDNWSNGIPLNVRSLVSSNSLELRIDKYCVGNNYIGMEIHVWRARMGYAEVSWGRAGEFDSDRSIKRFYPDQNVVMQFAFYRELSDDVVKLELSQGVAESAIVRTMRDLTGSVDDGAGIVIAEPTAPGGSTKISKILLFCLQ